MDAAKGDFLDKKIREKIIMSYKYIIKKKIFSKHEQLYQTTKLNKY